MPQTVKVFRPNDNLFKNNIYINFSVESSTAEDDAAVPRMVRERSNKPYLSPERSLGSIPSDRPPVVFLFPFSIGLQSPQKEI